MKHTYRSLHHAFERAFWALLLFMSLPFLAQGQGVNRNIWLFGDCEPGRAFLSFGANDAVSAVPLGPNTVAGRQVLGPNTVATAINQATGNLLFYTNGGFVYDGNHSLIGGAVNLGGATGNLQAVAIAVGEFDVDPAIPDSYFIFYITQSGDLGLQQVGVTNNDVAAVGAQDNNFRSGVGPAIKLIDNPNVDNGSFLFYYSGGNLVALDIQGATPASWTEETLPLANAPVQIRFNEETNQVIVVDANNQLTLIDFDPATGQLSNARAVASPGAGEVGGMTFSADGDFLFVSVTNPTTGQGTLHRLSLGGGSWSTVPIGDVTPGPEAILDIRVGPNGRLYVLYEIPGSGRVKIAELENPEEPLQADFIWEVDRFPGIDFCARMFPTFSTTVTFTPTVQIIAPPGNLCPDSPVPW
ncbi:hypothetical protein A3SI_15593 [Nitritalea halalkaliphila LW7]|uniref:Uncharacterized protein n=1 Tax=Nitritalea halalkaliphila LW7 TaxID=1189621 RepID=I5BYA3_9BACT|nr:hypothetical protein [Nitritalea halalkaliphila]EIM74555.1 hypothetical protein A3SI_15593 [Nitritalea halalkaliphila LW7]